MKQMKEKTIITQVGLSIDFLGRFAMELHSNPQVTIGNFFDNWQNAIGFKNGEMYSLVNQGVILTHLYGLIVFPKEIFHKEIPCIRLNESVINNWGKPIFLGLPNKLEKHDKNILGIESVSTESDLTLEFFIRKIRNAISHGKILIHENMDFIFEDKDGTKIKFDISGVQKFTETFRTCFMSQKWS